jgi:hypothetical protein
VLPELAEALRSAEGRSGIAAVSPTAAGGEKRFLSVRLIGSAVDFPSSSALNVPLPRASLGRGGTLSSPGAR